MMQIMPPTTCPCCSYLLEQVNDQLFCRNVACPDQTAGKVEHFAKTIGIKGLGPKSIEKLQISEVTELFYLDEAEVTECLGQKVALKLLDEIERSKVSSLEIVIAAFSIPLIGNTAAKKLCTVIQDINEITQETCKSAGLGDKATQNLLNWLDTEYQELKEFLPFSFKNSGNKIASGETVCITGKLKSFNKKADAEVALNAAGFTLVDAVTKSTKYLVDEGNVGSSKREKAEKYGITIITDLNDLLKVK